MPEVLAGFSVEPAGTVEFVGSDSLMEEEVCICEVITVWVVSDASEFVVKIPIKGNKQ